MRPLRKLTFTFSITILISVTLLAPCVKTDIKLTSELVEPVKNWSFEARDMPDPYIPNGGVYGCPPWETNKQIGPEGGWRELRGDCYPYPPSGNGDAWVNGRDLGVIGRAFGSKPGDWNWNPYADLNGDAFVDGSDEGIAGRDFGKEANRVDGSYSWYTSGGGDYSLYQWVDMDTVMLLAGETVRFSFYFYPESVASNGSQNNARAEIYFVYATGDNTVYGTWITPTVLTWYNAYVTVSLPSTTLAIAVIIHGKPDFKAWVDSAHLTTSGYNLYYTRPPYDNQGSLGTTYGDRMTGQASSYSSAYPPVISDFDYVQFNMDPAPGNSPQVYQEGDGFYIGAYWEAWGYLGSNGAASSSVSITLYLYYLRIGYGWELVTSYTRTYSSIDYPNQPIYHLGPYSRWISSPPRGSGTYAIGARTHTSAASLGGSTFANFLYYGYYMFIYNIKMSD